MRITIELLKSNPEVFGTLLPCGTRTGDVLLTVNETQLGQRLAPRALSSKTGRAAIAGGAISMRRDGSDLVLKVDEAQLLRQLGPRALRVSSRRSTLADGAVVVRAVNVTETGESGRFAGRVLA